MDKKVDMKSMNMEELVKFIEELGEKKFRAKQIYEWIHIKHVKSFEEMTNISKKFAESNPVDFIKKAAKAAYYAKTTGTAYIKAISACPLNWNDKPATERNVIEAAVNSCYFPLYEIEKGITRLSYNPEKNGKKIPITDWLTMMGRTKHLQNEEYRHITKRIQEEVDSRFAVLKKKATVLMNMA